MTAVDAPLLSVRGLRVALNSGRDVVQDVSFELRRGSTLGLVGESGSGKTTTALALLGYTRDGMRITDGEVEIQGETMALNNERQARRLRGRLVSHVPQDPATSLNPSLRVQAAIRDVLQEHRAATSGADAVLDSLRRVQLPADQEFARRFPHQLSGGQQQRVLIATALVCEPPLIVLDEPTTGLDVVTQSRILAEIERLHREQDITMVYISHDIAVVSQVADEVAVMYAGTIVEHGPAAEVLSRPRHPYTRGIIESIPDHARPRPLRGIPGVAAGIDDRPRGCPFAPRCDMVVDHCREAVPPLELVDGRHVRCPEALRTPRLAAPGTLQSAPATLSEADRLLSVEGMTAVHHQRNGRVVAADNVSFTVPRGACVALVGESGSGKTTIARAIVGLHPPASGTIRLGAAELAPRAQQRSRELRRRCQIVFQNPYESLNPRHRVVDEIARPAKILRGLSDRDAKTEVTDLLERVRLPARLARRYPGELSGGERQRVAIARALAPKPDLLICDEITSALDVSEQAAVLELLAKLRAELGLSLLFITHNLGVVATIADHVLILERGRVCEEGDVRTVFSAPANDYTVQLLAAAPTLPSSSN